MIHPTIVSPMTMTIRDCHRFLKPTGFATGLPGVQVRVQTFVPPKNPYPWHRYTGLMRFKTPLKIARECQLITHFQPISAHYNLSTTTTTLEIMNRDSKGGEMGGASTHLPRRYVSLSI